MRYHNSGRSWNAGDVRGVSVACIRPANIVVVVTEAPFRNDKIMSVMGTQERSRLQHLPATGYLTACPGAARSSQPTGGLTGLAPGGCTFSFPFRPLAFRCRNNRHSQEATAGAICPRVQESVESAAQRLQVATRYTVQEGIVGEVRWSEPIPSLSVIHALC